MAAAGLVARLTTPLQRLSGVRRFTLATGVLALVAILANQPLVDRWPATFAAPEAASFVSSPGRFEERIVDGPRGGHTHAPAAVSLGGGRLFVVWWSGRVEAGPGVSLYASTFENGAWSPRRLIIDPRRVAADLGRSIKTIGNPSLVRHADGRIEMIFVTVSLGGWSGAALNRTVSTDEGQSWSRITRLWTSPVLNLSTLAKSPPIPLGDGTLMLPTYHELVALRSEMTRINAQGRVIDRRRLSNTVAALQPDVTILSPGAGAGPSSAVAFHRPTARTPNVLVNRTDDAGRTWTPLAATSLVTPDSAVASVELGPDDLLIAYNPGSGLRNALVLARSRDGGQTWRDIHRVVDDQTPDPRLVAYPWMFRSGDGLIHLFYAADSYATIRHVMFDQAWIEARP